MSAFGFLYKLHISTVVASLLLFVARGIGVQRQHHWPMQGAARWWSVVIDTLLLSAGIGLWIVANHNPVHEPWLALKLFLVVLYIVLGSFALKRAPTLTGKRWCFLAALLTILFVASVALRRSPWGVLG